jgi:hypothetical protein
VQPEAVWRGRHRSFVVREVWSSIWIFYLALAMWAHGANVTLRGT